MKRASPAEPVTVDRAAQVYVEECCRHYPGNPPDEVINRFAEAFVARDYFALEFAFNGLNAAAREAFARLSGLVLPAGQAAGREVLRQWAGIPQELIEVRRASKVVASERRALESRMRHQPGLVDQSIDWINKQLEAGFDRIQHVGRSYYLVNAAGEGLDLSKKNTGFHLLRPMIQAIIDLRAKEEAYVNVLQAAGEPAAPELEEELSASVAESIDFRM